MYIWYTWIGKDAKHKKFVAQPVECENDDRSAYWAAEFEKHNRIQLQPSASFWLVPNTNRCRN